MTFKILSAISWIHGVTFNFGSAIMCSSAIFETCFLLIAKIYGLLQLIIIVTVLFPVTAILQLINFTASLFLVY